MQAFTNPLWVLLNAAAALGNQLPWHIFLSSLALSFVVSLLSVGVLSLGVARSTAAGIFALITLTFSRAFVDFSTSGLENPMNHLLLAIFAWVLVTVFGLAFRGTEVVTAVGRVRLVYGLALLAMVTHSLFYDSLFEDPIFWSLFALVPVAFKERA